MQLKTSWFVALLAIVGCGPEPSVHVPEAEPWMLGWFSDMDVELGNSPENLHFDDQHVYNVKDDGTVIVEAQYSCGSSVRQWTLLWTADDNDTLFLTAPPDSEPFPSDNHDGWILRRLPGCSTFEIVSLLQGQERTPITLFPGKVCLEYGPSMPDCIGHTCNVCYKSWCDGEAPADCESDE